MESGTVGWQDGRMAGWQDGKMNEWLLVSTSQIFMNPVSGTSLLHPCDLNVATIHYDHQISVIIIGMQTRLRDNSIQWHVFPQQIYDRIRLLPILLFSSHNMVQSGTSSLHISVMAGAEKGPFCQSQHFPS